MAEWTEVMKQFDRMCWHYQREHKCPMECPMGGVNISQCRKIAFEFPGSVERIVMSWVDEHSEPVYPTWFEWLEDIGIVSKAKSEYSQIYDVVLPALKMFEPIPADIAKKLGIEPKDAEELCS